jgi:hypothetical protein
MKAVSVIEKSVVLDTIFSVDFTVCTSFESNLVYFGGKKSYNLLYTYVYNSSILCNFCDWNFHLSGVHFYLEDCA